MTKPRKKPPASEVPQTVEEATAEAKRIGLKEPRPEIAEAIQKASTRRAHRPARVSIVQEITPQRVMRTGPPHSDVQGWGEHLFDTFGTSAPAFVDESLGRLANATRTDGSDSANGVPTQGRTNAALAVMGAVDPQNELEALIGEQIIAAHTASMDFLYRARSNAGKYIDAAAAYTNMATKVSRTMATHIEALAKLRSGGKQQVVVKHIYINGPAVIGDGAQAVMTGAPAQGGGGFDAKPDQSYAPLQLAGGGDAADAALWGEDPLGLAMPFAGRQRAQAMQDARRDEPGCADREGQRSLSNGAAYPGADGSSRPGPRDDGDAEG